MNRYPEYIFSKEIKVRLRGFKRHLEELGNAENTIRQRLNYTGYFLKWLDSENLQAEHARYNDMLNFIDHCRLEGKSKRHINSMLRSIRSYYEYLKKQNQGITNPALNLYLRGIRQKLPSGIKAYRELEDLYKGYNTDRLRDKRNKVILGLFVYQGITTGELQRMEPAHLRLRQGRIYIPGTRRSNSRVLDLKPFQVLELAEYVSDIRPQILCEIRKSRPARKPDRIDQARLEDQLFMSINGSENIKNSLLHMFRKIRKTHPEIYNPKQIRASVITHWLKNYNLRQVQYMAGHKYVSSTERYQLNNLDNLQSKLERYHPLGQV
jgi:integrase/recombinase XerD